jgi:acetyl-CoA C-acetyltransferase
MSRGIKDKVAIVGMGCTKFGEHWDKNADDLMIEAAYSAYEDAGVSPEDIEAYWLGTHCSGYSGLALSSPLKIDCKPVTRVENFCATGTDAFRNACYAVASGAYDIALAIGVEKLKDSGISGLVVVETPSDGTRPNYTAPSSFAFVPPAYGRKYGLDPKKMKEVLARIAWKNHKNGSLNPRAHFRSEVSMEKILNSPIVADPLGIMDCSGVSDGSAAAVIVRAEDAHKYRKDPVYVKALSIICGSGSGILEQDFDFTGIHETHMGGLDAYRQAGVSNPREEISLAEVHDCFTPSELLIYEDLGFSERGKGWKDALDGVFDLDGALPVNPDGGLKSFGHPIGASGIRMLYELYLQFQGRAEKRQLDDARLGLTHNMGGWPWHCVASVCILGRDKG